MSSDLPPPQDQPLSRGAEWRRRISDQPVWVWIVAVVVMIVIWRLVAAHNRNAERAKKGRGGAALPVGAAAVRRGDMPVYYDGLGSVSANYTVTVHSRVDGQLMSVNVREGQYVDQGQVLAQIDPRPFQAALDQAQGQLLKDQAALANAQLDLERYKGLYAQNAIPKQQLDTQAATVGQDEGAVKTDEAAVETAQLNVTYARVTAPISGRIGLRQVDPGNIIHATDANGMLVITQLHPIAVIFTLPEDDLPPIMQKISSRAVLPVEALNRDKTQHLANGRLLTVDNQIDPATGTSKLKAVFNNTENTLFPNQFVNVRLLLDTEHNQLIIPAVAVQRGAQGTFVYVIKPDNTVDAQPVKVGVTEGTDTSIVEGLTDGAMVVIDGADKLQPGSKVSITSPNTANSPNAPTTPNASQGGTQPAAGKHGKRRAS